MANFNINDVLLHDKKDDEEYIILPFTRYENVMGAPSIVTDIDTYRGSPYFFYVKDIVEVDNDVLKDMIGDIFTNP